MTLSKQQIQTLVGLIASSQSDDLSCDECFGRIGEYAEKAIEFRELSEGMRLIQRHLEQCPCCSEEYQTLLEALREIEV